MKPVKAPKPPAHAATARTSATSSTSATTPSSRRTGAPLHDFADLRKAWAQAARDAAREAAERAARERAERERVEHDHLLFVRSVGRVEPLREDGRHPSVPPRPEPLARQRALDDAAVLRESISDEIDVESLLETDEALSFRRPGLGLDVVRKLRRGHWAIQRQIDLHGMRRDEARESLAAFLREASRQGTRCVRVVHGKGHGSPGREPVLKGKVRGWLVQKEEVLAFVQARASEGGHGALVVLLRSTPASSSRHLGPHDGEPCPAPT